MIFICRDCTYFKNMSGTGHPHYCTHYESRKVDIVTGEVTFRGCEYMRGVGSFATLTNKPCGRLGKLFEEQTQSEKDQRAGRYSYKVGDTVRDMNHPEYIGTIIKVINNGTYRNRYKIQWKEGSSSTEDAKDLRLYTRERK